MTREADGKSSERAIVLRTAFKLVHRVIFYCLGTLFVVIYILAMSDSWLFEGTRVPAKLQYSICMIVIVWYITPSIYRKIANTSRVRRLQRARVKDTVSSAE